MNHLKNIITLSRINKPIGIFLLLWPTLTALWVAQQGIPALKILIIFILGTILMRSAGCIANDLADRNIDKFVNRTKSRPPCESNNFCKTSINLLHGAFTHGVFASVAIKLFDNNVVFFGGHIGSNLSIF